MSNTITKSQAKTKNKKGFSAKKKEIDAFETKLQEWAHEGTRESLDKIINFINHEKDEDLKAYAKIAYGEAAFFYYSPNNESEEIDFLTAKMIKEIESQCIDLKYRIEAGELAVQKENIDIKIHEEIMKNKKNDPDWKYRNPKYYAGFIKNRLKEIKDDLNFKKAWIKAAKKMIKNKKYKDIPFDILNHIHLDIEDLDWMDN